MSKTYILMMVLRDGNGQRFYVEHLGIDKKDFEAIYNMQVDEIQMLILKPEKVSTVPPVSRVEKLKN